MVAGCGSSAGGCSSASVCSSGFSMGVPMPVTISAYRSTDPKIIAERNERAQRIKDKKSRAKTKIKTALAKVKQTKAKV